jgi:hypothetical protein
VPVVPEYLLIAYFKNLKNKQQSAELFFILKISKNKVNYNFFYGKSKFPVPILRF